MDNGIQKNPPPMRGQCAGRASRWVLNRTRILNKSRQAIPEKYPSTTSGPSEIDWPEARTLKGTFIYSPPADSGNLPNASDTNSNSSTLQDSNMNNAVSQNDFNALRNEIFERDVELYDLINSYHNRIGRIEEKLDLLIDRDQNLNLLTETNVTMQADLRSLIATLSQGINQPQLFSSTAQRRYSPAPVVCVSSGSDTEERSYNEASFSRDIIDASDGRPSTAMGQARELSSQQVPIRPDRPKEDMEDRPLQPRIRYWKRQAGIASAIQAGLANAPKRVMTTEENPGPSQPVQLPADGAEPQPSKRPRGRPKKNKALTIVSSEAHERASRQGSETSKSFAVAGSSEASQALPQGSDLQSQPQAAQPAFSISLDSSNRPSTPSFEEQCRSCQPGPSGLSWRQQRSPTPFTSAPPMSSTMPPPKEFNELPRVPFPRRKRRREGPQTTEPSGMIVQVPLNDDPDYYGPVTRSRSGSRSKDVRGPADRTRSKTRSASQPTMLRRPPTEGRSQSRSRSRTRGPQQSRPRKARSKTRTKSGISKKRSVSCSGACCKKSVKIPLTAEFHLPVSEKEKREFDARIKKWMENGEKKKRGKKGAGK